MTFKFRKARSDRTLSDLESFLRNIGDEPVEFLTRTFDDWRQISYDELEDLILSGRAQDLIDWRERYAEFVNTKLSPLWLTAIQTAAYNSTHGKITIDDSDPRVKDFLQRRGSELTTQLSDESRKAVANVILHGQSERLAPREIARQIRPLIGLNQRQAQANVNYRQKIFRQLIDSGLSTAQAQIRADKAAVKYASKQHRQRAETIVHTELARAYNQGAHDGVLSAQRAGLMNVCEMVWTTSGTNRVCGRCLSLKDTVVGRTNEVGVQLPPLHPRCRCTISYRELTSRPSSGNVQPNSSTISPLSAPPVGGNLNTTLPAINNTFTAKTIAEANEFAIKVLGVPNAEYKGCAIEVANEWNAGLVEAFKKFPELKKHFGFVGEMHERNAAYQQALIAEYAKILQFARPSLSITVANEIAKRQASKKIAEILPIQKDDMSQSWVSNKGISKQFRGVVVNKIYAENLSVFLSTLEQSVMNKIHPVGCVTVRSALDHEIAHQLDALLGLRDMPEVQELFDSRVTVKNGTEDFSRITAELSRYAWDNRNTNRYAEFIAEAWAEYCNNPAPREIAKKLGEIVEREYTKKFGRGE